MVVESLAGLPSVAIVAILLVGYLASWKHLIPVMAVTAIIAVFIAIEFGSPLGILFDIPNGTPFSEIFLKVTPSIMLTMTAALGYYYSFRRKPVHAIAMAFLMVTSLVLGW